MAYQKKTWASGDTITAAALNNIEEGIDELDDALGGSVRYDAAQTLTTAQKEQARENIGVSEMLSANEAATLSALSDGVIVWTDHSASSGHASYVPVDVKTGDIVYVEVTMETTDPTGNAGVYMSVNGGTPLYQATALYAPGRICITAERDYSTVVFWYNVVPSALSIKIYKDSTVRRMTRIQETQTQKSVVYNYTGTSTMASVPFESHKGDVIYVNVSNIVCTGYQNHMTAFGRGLSDIKQSTSVAEPGLNVMVANDDYSYIHVYFNVAGMTSARISICRYSEKSTYKTFSILGDSYSCYEGYLPSGNVTSYPITGNDVDDVSQMWWRKYGDMNGMTLVADDSWTGSPFSSFAWNVDQSGKAFTTRVKRLPESDVIFVFGGMNDSFGSADLGDYKYSEWTVNDLNAFRPSVAYVLSWLKSNRPYSDVVLVTDDVTGSGYRTSMAEIAAHYDVPFITVHNISKDSTTSHPDQAGMIEIGAQVSDALLTRRIDKTAQDSKLKAMSEQLATLTKAVEDLASGAS